MTRDAQCPGGFELDWLVPLPDGDAYMAAIAGKAQALLSAVRYVENAHHAGHDSEVRVWLNPDAVGGCITVAWEPGLAKFGIHLLDESLRERLACIVLHDVPCVDASATLGGRPAPLPAEMRIVRQADVDLGISR